MTNDVVRVYRDRHGVIAERQLVAEGWSSVTNARFASELEARCWQELFWPEAKLEIDTERL